MSSVVKSSGILGVDTPAPIMERFGPGDWDLLHLRSFAIRTHQDKLDFIQFFYFVINTLKCGKCINHANQYNRDHPIEAYIDDLPQHVWKFHNAVNKRLGKEEISFEAACQLYEPRVEKYLSSVSSTKATNKARNTPLGFQKSTQEGECATCGNSARSTPNNNTVGVLPSPRKVVNRDNKFSFRYSVNGKQNKITATDFTPL